MELFDTMAYYSRPLHKSAAARNAIGEIAEEYACSVLKMDRLKVDGRKRVCSDACGKDGPVEIKSVSMKGKSLGAAIIYKFRIEKELEEKGPAYPYIFVCHSCPVNQDNASGIVTHFRDHPPKIVISTLGTMHDILSKIPHRQFNKPENNAKHQTANGRPMGWAREGYIDGGWNFRLSMLPNLTWSKKLGRFAGRTFYFQAAKSSP